MGRKIVCPDCGSIVDEDILKAKNSENTCLICGANLGGDSINKAEEHSDWITWYYYGFKSGDGKSATLSEKKIDLDKHGDTFFLIKEFQAPPRDENGSEKAKEILRTYIPDAFAPPAYDSAINEIRCPRCGSNRIQLVGRKWSWLTGIATNKVDRVCMNCKTRF
uniref:hypothetical protein n=1 Tax=Enterocloster clostridioformis TaxID=1531 RepID=UPI0026EDB9CB|nr:hypothetical protein [Enterocloster clostridioformis]